MTTRKSPKMPILVRAKCRVNCPRTEVKCDQHGGARFYGEFDKPLCSMNAMSMVRTQSFADGFTRLLGRLLILVWISALIFVPLIAQCAAKPPPSALHDAVTSGSRTAVLKLIGKGADVNGQNPYKQTPLYLACQRTNEALARLLLDHGADVNARSSYGSTPVHVAAKTGSAPILQVLTQHGANLELQDSEGRSPLFWAIEGGGSSAVEVLVKAGAKLEQVGRDGLAPLHFAAKRGAATILETLIRSGANPNLPGPNGYRALHYAVEGRRFETVKKLCALGANANMPTDGGLFPRKLAAELDYSEIADWLDEAGGEFSHDLSFRFPSGKIDLSTDTQEYLSVIQVRRTGADRFVVLVCEPHFNSQAQWMMYWGLRYLFSENPELVTNAVFLCEGVPAGVPIAIEPLRRVEPAPDDDLLKSVLDSFLLPGYLGFQWASKIEIPTFGAEDDALYQIAVRFAANGGSWSAGNLSLVSRNPSMAATAGQNARAGKIPLLFTGLGHIDKIPQDLLEHSRVGLSFWSQRFQVGPREQRLLWAATNTGVADLLVQQHVDYLVIQAYGQGKPASSSDVQRYYRLFQAQLTGRYEDYIKRCLLEQGHITVQPSPTAAAQLAVAVKAAKSAEKDKDKEKDKEKNKDSKPEKGKYPKNPDDWKPPEEWKETEAGEKTGGKHRQWKDETGKIRRRWDAAGREGGKERGPHWHDSDDASGGKKHIEPDS
jgi:ankyrin repeat protein